MPALQAAPRQKYSSAGAQAALTTFYSHAGKLICVSAYLGSSPPSVLQPTNSLMHLIQGMPVFSSCIVLVSSKTMVTGVAAMQG